ncbi:MAG TPA: hypothetical protein VGY54_01025, partial [Polyangiaceae bacterium]|nr:hypothetical protein [Polyangiaceae bacterium]
LQITANQQTLAGRQRLLSVPYAERAAEAMQAASADGPAPDGGIDMRLNALQGAHDNLAATVVDLASNQTIAGNKTFTGTLTTSGGLAVLEPDGGAFSVNGVPAMIFGGWYCNPGGGYPTGSVNPLTVHRPVRQVSRARSCSRPAASPAVRACARS